MLVLLGLLDLAEGKRGMTNFRNGVILSGVAALAIAMLGALLFMSHPAQSKDNSPNSSAADGISTTLGF